MKHKSAGAESNPLEIGRSVRVSIEAFLHDFRDVVDHAFPPRIEKFAACLALWGSKMNLTAHPDDPGELAFHVIDCLMPIVLASDPSNILCGRFAAERLILDLGSGAGFPGLVLAAASSASFTLVDSRRKRVSFLNFAVAEMGLRNVSIEAKRAEDFPRHRRFDIVTARALGDPREFFALASGLVKPDGLAMLYANPSQSFAPDVMRLPYTVERRGAKVQRLLAICRQLVEEPRARN